jgi:hypothetical protein
MDGWMFALLSPERFGRFYPYLVLGSLPLMGWFPVSKNIVAPKKKMGPKTEIGDLVRGGAFCGMNTDLGS